jgi:hypothetical protein
MKNSTLLLVLILSVQGVFANDGRYYETMQKNILAVYTAQNISDLQNTVNSLERIGQAEKTKWEPYYYESFGYIMMSNKEQDNLKKDQYLDQASASLEKAKAILAEDSEIIALEGFISMMRISVDPAARGSKYSTLAMQAYGKAMALNPENPRAIALMAQMQWGTAKFFGAPITDACNLAGKAEEKFATYKSENPLAPQWGKEMNAGLKSQCK